MKKIAFTFLLITLVFSCKKDKKTPLEQLPDATQEGKGTFGCLINGEAFIPKGGFTSPSLTVDYYKNGIVGITARNYESDKLLHFYISDRSLKTGQYTDTDTIFYPIKGPGYFLLSKVNLKTFAAFYIDTQGCEYETDSTNIGLLTITNFRQPSLGSNSTTIPGIISGTFYFTVKTPGCPDVNVTDGRFDISF